MLLIIICVLLAAGCAPQAMPATPTPGVTRVGTLRPYPSDTPSPTLPPTDYVSPTPSPTITPTPTPVYYTVKGSDDMFGIALRYGISLEALKTANPTVLPNFMGEGTMLLIPITPQAAVSPSPTVMLTLTPTPLYSKLHEPVCYADGTGGLTCFILVENNTGTDLENVGGVLTLIDTKTGETIQQVGIMSLNLLRKGTVQPILVYLDAPIPEEYTLSFLVDVVFPVPAEDTRYLNASITAEQINYNPDQTAATLSGKLQLVEDGKTAGSLWVLAVAYDSDDKVVGMRRWESAAPLKSGSQMDFRMTVYSMADPIERVDLLTEARSLTP